MKEETPIYNFSSKRFVTLTISKEEYKRDYSLRGRIGITILRILGILELRITDK